MRVPSKDTDEVINASIISFTSPGGFGTPQPVLAIYTPLGHPAGALHRGRDEDSISSPAAGNAGYLHGPLQTDTTNSAHALSWPAATELISSGSIIPQRWLLSFQIVLSVGRGSSHLEVLTVL